MPHPNDSYHARRRRKGLRPSGGKMRVIGGRRPEPLLEPGVDFLYERSIDQSAGERVIDTEFTFFPGVPTRLNGRKYVGENTVIEMAKLIGWVPGDEARRIQAEFDAYKAQVQTTVDRLKDAADAINHAATTGLTDTSTPVATPPDDSATGADKADAKARVEADQIAAAEAATTPKEATSGS